MGRGVYVRRVSVLKLVVQYTSLDVVFVRAKNITALLYSEISAEYVLLMMNWSVLFSDVIPSFTMSVSFMK